MKNQVVTTLITLLLSACLHGQVTAQSVLIAENTQQQPLHTEIQDIEKLYEGIRQGARSVSYYKYRIQNQNYLGQEHLTFRVIAEDFGSDPDIFISKSKNNIYPNSAANSDWYCERKGSETCIIQKGDFAIGETLYFGIKCENTCSYKLKILFTPTVDLTTSNRQQMRFQAYSTYILKYVIPDKVQEDNTKSVEIYVQPEHSYVPVDLFLSLDPSFYLIEETPAAHVTSTGKSIKFSENEENWCRNCPIYAIINVYADDRYYITSIGRVDNDELSNIIPHDIFVNQFEQQCYQYFVERTKFDVRFDIEGYSGIADAYLTAKTLPSGPDSVTVDLRLAHGANRAVSLGVASRNEFGQTAGTYYLCFYAYVPFSARVTVSEAETNMYFDSVDGQIQTTHLSGNSYFVSRYTNTAFLSKGVISVVLEGQGLTETQDPPKLYYKICESDEITNCAIEQQNLDDGGICELNQNGACGSTAVNITKGEGAVALIAHDPANCANPAKCYYIFAVRNQDAASRGVSLLVAAKFEDPGEVELEKIYNNVVTQGQYIPHKISQNLNSKIQPYIDSLKITVESKVGDADLFVSQSNPNPTNENTALKSRLLEPIDQVVLRSSDSVDLTQPIYFTVYGNMYSEVIITFEYTFRPTYDEQLERAIPVGDSQYAYTYIPDEYGERLYAFSPWWSGKENRTTVFLADVIFNRVFFYSRWNAYPKHFYTSKHDYNDTIAIYGNDPDSKHNGVFYARLRPDFALYDMLSSRQYIFNMFAFSQTPATWGGKQLAFENIELGQTYLGFANQSRYQDYRYMQIDMRATYTITVKRIPGLGTPQFYVGLVDRGYLNNIGELDDGVAPREDRFAFAGEPTPGKNASRSNLTLTGFDRSAKSPRCATVRHSAQGTDQQACAVAISIKCKGEQQCAYQLKIDKDDIDLSVKQFANRQDGSSFTPHPPSSILAEDYISSRVDTKSQVKYYYFPIDHEFMHEGMILLNKTQIYGTGRNGDTKLIVNIIKDTEDDGSGNELYQNWNYPTESNAQLSSGSGADVPEVVEVCNKVLTQQCQGAKGCGMLVGVVGQSDTLASYRLKGFYGRNKLYLDKPIFINTTQHSTTEDHFDYYWFVINDAAVTQGANFEYQVSVATDGSGDPDLYVSLMDGRFPTETDYDYRSNQAGADSIRIENYDNSTIWKQRGWNVSAGVVVVVGVKVNKPMNYTLVLTTPPKQVIDPYLTMKRIKVGDAPERVNLTAAESNQYTMIYQFYNWLHRDFEITFSYLQGDQNATVMYQKTGQLNKDNNIYTGVPIGVNNSFGAFNVSQGKFRLITINGSSCYSCWYFIRIDINNTDTTRYEFSIADKVDNSGQYFDMTINQIQQLTVRGNFWQRTKFILDSKDNWVLRTVVATGDLDIYIGANPDTVDKGGHIWQGSTQQGRDIQIAVKTTDPNFHIGTYYYVYLVSRSTANVQLKLSLIQEREVHYLGINYDFTYNLKHSIFQDWNMVQKFQYKTNQEEVKFHVFRVPPPETNPGFHSVKIMIDPLTPNFYPQVYINKIELSVLQRRIADLPFPNLVNHDIAFGENPFYQLNSKTFQYSFTGQASQKFVYYTVAIYQHNWGLTTMTKSSYQIKVVAENVSSTPLVQSTMRTQNEPMTLEEVYPENPMFMTG